MPAKFHVLHINILHDAFFLFFVFLWGGEPLGGSVLEAPDKDLVQYISGPLIEDLSGRVSACCTKSMAYRR